MNDLILVTGGAGFIGSHLVEALLTAGDDVRVLDDFSTGKPENIRGAEALAAAHGGRFQLIAGDVRDEDKVREAVDAEVPRVVLASSCAVYGDAATLPVAETSPTQPLSPYAEAKLASEETCSAAADAGQIVATCLRFFNVFGPRQDPGSEYSGVISRFMAAAAAGAPVTIYGDGEQTRDFVYVGDVVQAMLRALVKPLSGVAVLNVGSGAATSVLDVLGRMEELSGRALERRRAPARAGDIRHSRADAGRARWVLGWEAEHSFADGMAETWAWYREQA